MPTSSEPLTFYPVLLVSLKQRSAYDISIFIIFPSHDWIVSPPGNYVCPHVHIFGGMLVRVRVISMQPSATTRGLLLLLLLLIHRHHQTLTATGRKD